MLGREPGPGVGTTPAAAVRMPSPPQCQVGGKQCLPFPPAARYWNADNKGLIASATQGPTFYKEHQATRSLAHPAGEVELASTEAGQLPVGNRS